MTDKLVKMKEWKNTCLAFILILFVSLSLCGQDNKIPNTTGAFYAISVADMDAAISWYSKILGFQVESQGSNEQRKGAILTRPGTILELGEFSNAIQLKEIKPNIESHEINGIFKMGFITEDIDKTFAVLEAEKVEIFFPIVESSYGKRTFGIKDLDGNIIQFFEE